MEGLNIRKNVHRNPEPVRAISIMGERPLGFGAWDLDLSPAVRGE
jgi:hypothetical protein